MATSAQTPLSDEELVRQTLSGDREAGEELARRYLRFVRKFVTTSVYAHHDCPGFCDVSTFIEEVVSRVMTKFVTSLGSFRFEKPFEHWVKVISRNAAIDYNRELIGRASAEQKRRFVTLEVLADQAVPFPENVLILDEVLDIHGKQSERNARCIDAIKMRIYEVRSNEEIANDRRQHPDYLSKEFTRNFSEMESLLSERYRTNGGAL